MYTSLVTCEIEKSSALEFKVAIFQPIWSFTLGGYFIGEILGKYWDRSSGKVEIEHQKTNFIKDPGRGDKMKKKGITLFMMGMLAVSMVGCSSSSEEETSDDSEEETVDVETEEEESDDASQEQQEGQQEKSAEDADEGTDEESDEEADEESAVETEEEIEEEPEITFESLTAVDNEECSIVITGIEEDKIWGYSLNVQLENKSSEITYRFSVQDAAINGVSATDIFSVEIAPGKQAIDTISFSNIDELQENEIGDFTDIKLHFKVYDSDDWRADAAAEVTVHVYPYGEENAVAYTREDLDTDYILVDDDNVKAVVMGYEIDSIWGYKINLYLENKTEAEAMFSVDKASINGIMCDPFWAKTVVAGDCAFSSITWYESSLEEIGITDLENEIETIEFVFRAHNSDDYSMDDYINETFTLTPQ